MSNKKHVVLTKMQTNVIVYALQNNSFVFREEGNAEQKICSSTNQKEEYQMKKIFVGLALLYSFMLVIEASGQTPSNLVRWNDGGYTQDQTLSNGWIFRTVFTKEMAVEGRLYMMSKKPNSYAIDLDTDGNVKSVRISTSNKPGVIDGIFVLMDGKPRILEADVRNVPQIYLYEELLQSIEGLPKEIQNVLTIKATAVREAAKKPVTLTPVSNR